MNRRNHLALMGAAAGAVATSKLVSAREPRPRLPRDQGMVTRLQTITDNTPEGAHVFNLHGETVTLERIAEFINVSAHDGLITFGGPPIPIATAMDDLAIRRVMPGLPSTPFETGIRETMDRFTALRDAGRLDTSDLTL